MNARSSVSCILLATLVLFVLSTAVHAIEYKEVQAGDILKLIENGKEVNITDSHIIGELNLSEIKLETVPNPFFRSAKEGWILVNYNAEINENLKVIESNITIINSNFENSVNFSNVLFNKTISFKNTSFKDVDFTSTIFGDFVNFNEANFGDSANFYSTKFNGSAHFNMANFGNSANFYSTIFNGYTFFDEATFGDSANFMWSHFNDGVEFESANFNNFADFSGVNFNGDADFCETKFGDDPDFTQANFNDDVYFDGTIFGDSANFYLTVFNDFTDFSGANFGKSAYFYLTVFNDSAVFMGPDTSENIITDGRNCEFFIKWYKTEARYTDADNIYYTYRKNVQENKNLTLFSKLMDILSWVTCGYGVRLSHTIVCIVIILGVFSFLYWRALGVYRLSDASEKKSKVFRLEPILISIRGFTTLGSTDLYSKYDSFRILVTVEGLLGWIMLGIFMATLTNLLMRS